MFYNVSEKLMDTLRKIFENTLRKIFENTLRDSSKVMPIYKEIMNNNKNK